MLDELAAHFEVTRDALGTADHHKLAQALRNLSTERRRGDDLSSLTLLAFSACGLGVDPAEDMLDVVDAWEQLMAHPAWRRVHEAAAAVDAAADAAAAATPAAAAAAAGAGAAAVTASRADVGLAYVAYARALLATYS